MSRSEAVGGRFARLVVAAARAASGFRRDALSRSAHGAIYGIEFHAGIRSEHGDKRAFFRLVRTGRR